MGLFDWLKSPAQEVNGALQLAKQRDPRAVDALATLVERIGTHPDITGASAKIAHALGETADPRAVEPLIALLKGSDPGRDCGIVVTSGMAELMFRDNDPRGQLRGLAGSDLDIPYFVASGRKEALYALGRLRDARAVPTLLPWIAGSADERSLSALDERRVAAASLGWIGDPAAREVLAKLAHDEPGYCGKAADGALQMLDRRTDGAASGPVHIRASCEAAGVSARLERLMVTSCESRDVKDADDMAPAIVTFLKERGYVLDQIPLLRNAYSLSLERTWFEIPVFYGGLRCHWPELPQTGLMRRIVDLWLTDEGSGEFRGYACAVIAG